MSKNIESREPTPEDVAEIEKQRTISDAELLKHGAEYEIDENNEKILIPTEKQIKEIHAEMEKEIENDLEKRKKMIEDVMSKKIVFHADYSTGPFSSTTKRTSIFWEKGKPMWENNRGTGDLREVNMFIPDIVKTIDELENSSSYLDDTIKGYKSFKKELEKLNEGGGKAGKESQELKDLLSEYWLIEEPTMEELDKKIEGLEATKDKVDQEIENLKHLLLALEDYREKK